MANSRTFLFLSLLLMVILVISNDVSAGRDLADETAAYSEGSGQVESPDTIHEDGHGGYGGGKKCKWGKCCKGPHCHGAQAVEGEKEADENQAAEIDGNGGGKKCKWGKCCKGPHCHGAQAADEAQAAEVDGYGGGKKCKWGKCCKGPHCHEAQAGANNHN